MQSTIRSFFQPLARTNPGKQTAEKNHLEEEPIPKKKLVDSEQLVNGAALCTDSPVKPAAKKSAKVLNSEDEEDSDKPEGKDTQSGDSKQATDCVPEEKIPTESISPRTSPASSNSPSSIPRRKTDMSTKVFASLLLTTLIITRFFSVSVSTSNWVNSVLSRPAKAAPELFKRQRMNGSGRLVRQLEVPKNLSTDQKALIAQFLPHLFAEELPKEENHIDTPGYSWLDFGRRRSSEDLDEDV